MRNDELFIDGQIVDLDDNTKITLNYKSNIFSDLSKIVSNNSYTIKLPNTVHNQCVIEHADLPSHETKYPRYMHQCRYFRNGVEIIKEALGVLLSTGKTIDVAITWGNVSSLSNLASDDRKLNELSDTGQALLWDETQAIGGFNASDSYFYSEANYGIKVGKNTKTWYHPCVRVEWIIGLIEQTYDVSIWFPQEHKAFLRKLLIPCVTRSESDAVMRSNSVKFAFKQFNKNTYQIGGYKGGGYFEFTLASNPAQTGYGYIETRSSSDWSTKHTVYHINRDSEKTRVKVDVTVEMSTTGFDFTDTKLLVGQMVPASPQDYQLSFNYVSGVSLGGKTVRYVMDIEVPTREGSYFNFHISTVALYEVSKVVSFDVSISPQATRDIQYGELFPIIRNLPDIKVIDFLKNIMGLCGLFAIPSEEGKGVINLSSMDIILQNKSKAVDWTRRVVAPTHENKPMEMVYILDGFAQHNKMKYKADSTVFGSYDSELTIYDNTIQSNRDAIALAFAASDSENGTGRLPLYKLEEGGYALQKVEPRLLLEADNGGKSKMVFTGLEWPTLIESFYKGYQEVIAEPIIIKEKIEISDIQLKKLDMTVPVYLAQYGRYYAIVSIKAESSGICECQLLQLEV